MNFVEWVISELGVDDQLISDTLLVPAFDVLLSRIEEARRNGADDPMVTVSPKLAGGNSRACTRRMLAQLGLTLAQRRVMHRLLAGSPSGWPGLLVLYSYGMELTAGQRQYARRQLALVASQAHPVSAGSTRRPCRSGSKAG